MIIDFKVSNFRSLKNEVDFTLKADSLKSKSDNTFTVDLVNDVNINLLKTAVIYGANASGKSNFIKAFLAFVWLVRNSSKFEIDLKKINCYEPFELDVNYENAPSIFKMDFILNNVKYHYSISYIKNEIIEEILDSAPKGQMANLYTRKKTEDLEYDIIDFGKNLTDRKIPKKIFKNQLYISKFGVDYPHEQLTKVYQYFANINVWNAADKFTISDLSKEISELISQSENTNLKNRLSKLIRISDTKIEEIDSKELNREDFQITDQLPKEIVDKFYESNKIRTFSYHKQYDNERFVKLKEFDFNKKESTGTKVLFALGGKILQALESGGIVVFDELDNSLHPKLCKFLIRLFNSKISNPKNAQLIFATHEVTLLDKDVFRKDQIWFAEKNKYGVTDIFCANEFEGLRDDTNFELWYRTGKFGGNPKIKEVEFIYQ